VENKFKPIIPIMSHSPNDWQKKDFIALILHYAANADLEITDDEKALITKMAGKVHYDKAVAYFDSASDYEVIQKIIELKAVFFAGEAGKKQLHALLIDLFQSDEEFNSMEHSTLHALERIF
jgi:hypothetical protein